MVPAQQGWEPEDLAWPEHVEDLIAAPELDLTLEHNEEGVRRGPGCAQDDGTRGHLLSVRPTRQPFDVSRIHGSERWMQRQELGVLHGTSTSEDGAKRGVDGPVPRVRILVRRAVGFVGLVRLRTEGDEGIHRLRNGSAKP